MITNVVPTELGLEEDLLDERQKRLLFGLDLESVRIASCSINTCCCADSIMKAPFRLLRG
jgi:hypothetical protein